MPNENSVLCVLCSVLCVLCSVPRIVGQSPDNKVKTVWDGVYTADQATRGQSAYRTDCAGCHGADLQGYVPEAASGGGNAPALVGNPFIERWREDDMVALFRVIRSGMPWGKPDTMSEDAKIDTLAYMLQANGFPAGNDELNTNVLASIRLVGKEGSKPLPSTTLVRVAGCLTKGANNVWMLTSAAEPVRTHKPDETTPQELKSSQAMPLGTLRFKLPSLDFAIPAVRPGPFRGHKVQVKGVVYRQPNNDSINVRSLVSLAASCVP